MRRLIILSLLTLSVNYSFGQTTEDLTVELSATTQVSPPRITLNWKRRTFDPPNYVIYKKAKTASSWGTPIVTLTSADSTYADNAVIVDSAYEYQVKANGASLLSTGYIYAGIKNPAIHNRGAMILIVDSTFSDSCSARIKTMMQDLSGDGWELIRHDVPRTMSDTAIMNRISHDYSTHANVKSVLLLGHVAVPYSGDLNPDGHPDHLGAWPADVYYACVPGAWNDVSINDVSGGYTANHNVPGDGKWDETMIPTTTQMQVSRVDFYNMPAFSATEVQMMNNYLAKDHNYKMDSLAVIHRGLISDNFGYFSGEGFAQNGWRNFAPLVGKDSVHAISFVSSLATSSYQWAYGCGGGTFTSAGGIGATTDFASNPENGIFTMLFGSYFGDWNVQNSFLRAPLCSSTPALTNCWAGRPNWFFHHMALGENIGYGARLTQNNNGVLYQPANYGAEWVHIALMGDLSLRTDYIKPITSLVITAPLHNGAILNWTASPDAGVIGYYVYRSDSAYGYFQQVSSLLTATTFHDVTGHNGHKYYMVRPVKLQSTPSGGYYNLGIGVTDTATVSFASSLEVAAVTPSIQISLFPNPATDLLNITVGAANTGIATICIVNEAGQQMSMTTKQLNSGTNAYQLNVAKYPAGIYTLKIKAGDNEVATKWVKL